jgi:hypothetical protein
MTAQSRKKWIIGRRLFHRILGGISSPQRQVFGQTSRSDHMHRRVSGGRWGAHSPGFAKHVGRLGVGRGAACIRHKLSARRPGRAVHASC